MAARQAPLDLSKRHAAASLRAVAQMVAQYGAALASTMATRAMRLSTDGVIEVDVYVDALTPAHLQLLQSYTRRIHYLHHQDRLLHAAIPVETLATIAALPFVRWIGPASSAVLRTGRVTSAGDEVLFAAEAREMFGVDGSGVRIGIISDSLLNPAASGEDLPSDIIILDAGRNSPQSDEGRALAEIIHDLAPGATLLFHSGFPNSFTMVEAIEALAAREADIIIDDLGFFREPVFEDGQVASAVRRAIEDDGVIYVTAAGNDANAHYQGVYREFDPNDGDPSLNLHDFGAGDVTMSIVIAPGSPERPSFFSAFLQWPDRFDGSANTADYDLLLFDASGREPACELPGVSGNCVSDNRQLGGHATPIEDVIIVNTSSEFVTVNLLVNRVAGAALPLSISFLGDATILEHTVASGSVFGHPCVRGALAVGAIRAADAGFDSIEPFSSHGPCEIFFDRAGQPLLETRSKPDIVAADGVMTSMPRFNPFFGTSAAAPHVAAIAALLIDYNRTFGNGAQPDSAMADVLRLAAVDLGQRGPDNVFGYGKIDAVKAIGALQDVLAMRNRAPRSTITAPAADIVVRPGAAVTLQGDCVDINGADRDTINFAWTFGGGSPQTSDLRNPGAVVFPEPGIFTVTLTCTDASGASDTTVRTVTVNQPPVGSIDRASQTVIDVGSSVDFAASCRDAENHTPFTFLWYFGGGVEPDSSTQQNPTGQFDVVGTYTVTLICTDALGIADATPPTLEITVVKADDDGGGGCGLLHTDQYRSPPPSAALGNILLPLFVMLALRIWQGARCRYS